IADVNSDGRADILSASDANSGVLSLTAVNGSDGSILWSVEVSHYGPAATVLDLDGDGFNEVVFPYGRSPTRLLILDGRDGSVKLEQDLFNSRFGTCQHFPNTSATISM
ncbi:MAG TPA: VCBS repeat-containing protein, partial [Arenicellales bacterium]|nr:VCBS repeat-containing protein [Arenicellales bacterium]